ncbi:MAG: hypothetical protein ACJAX5_002201 [Patiriisocius sp.]|jgi:hypothetical protein
MNVEATIISETINIVIALDDPIVCTINPDAIGHDDKVIPINSIGNSNRLALSFGITGQVLKGNLRCVTVSFNDVHLRELA